MAQYDLLLVQNTHATLLEFTERLVAGTRGGLITFGASSIPTTLAPGNSGYVLKSAGTGADLYWDLLAGGHTQNTDTGTDSAIFELDTDVFKIELTAESASKFGVKVDGGATYADLQVKDIICNDLTVNGTTTTINATTITVDDKNIELGSVASPSDTTADGGGITLRGATDKTIIWDNANDNWSFNQSVNIGSGLTYKINNTSVLSSTQVLGVTLGTMAAETATNYVTKALYDAHTILYATTNDTPVALTIGEQTLVGRITSGNIAALTAAQIMGILWQTAPATKTSTGTAGWIARDDDYFYICIATNTWVRCVMATNW